MNTLQFTFPKNGIEEKLIVEAGHIYTDEEPTTDHQYGAKIGGTIANFLTSLGYQVKKWLFIDNYTPRFTGSEIILDESKYLEFLAKEGFTQDVMVYEASLTEQAQENISSLFEKNFAAKDSDGNICLNKGGIGLYDAKRDKFSCSLLDACFYMKKLKEADGAITILPWYDNYGKPYQSQQKKTLTVLKKLGVDTSKVLPVYFVSPAENLPASGNPYLINGSGSPVKCISMLKALGKMTEQFPIETDLEIEVMKYVV